MEIKSLMEIKKHNPGSFPPNPLNMASMGLAIPEVLRVSNKSLFADCHRKLKSFLYRREENFAFTVTDLYPCLYHHPVGALI